MGTVTPTNVSNRFGMSEKVMPVIQVDEEGDYAGGSGDGDASAANQETLNAAAGAVDDEPVIVAADPKTFIGGLGGIISLLASMLSIFTGWDNDTSPQAVVPIMESGAHISAQTSATGATYVAFGSQACKQLTVVNNTATPIEVAVAGTGVAIPIFSAASNPPGVYTFYGITNANQLSLRRIDQSNTQVTVVARWEA